ncbi:MAG: SMP-30/gluconolactonase/LRE family protein [Pseudomonadota bacterium]
MSPTFVTSGILEGEAPQLLATGFQFTEGPLWDPQGFFYFADPRDNALYKLVPGQSAERVRTTQNGNGTCFDVRGRLIQCEGQGKRLTAWDPASGVNGEVTVVANGVDGKRLNRPNDVICHTDGSLWFTDPDKRIPVDERELEASVWRIAPDGSVTLIAHCEYPNGLAFSPDERKLYVANTRFLKYVHELTLNDSFEVISRRVFADMSANPAKGSPDGVKVDMQGRVFCTGPGGIWVFTPDGEHIATIEFPEPPVNFTFGGDDLRTLFVCARSSVYSLRVVVPGCAQPWQRLRALRNPQPAEIL